MSSMVAGSTLPLMWCWLHNSTSVHVRLSWSTVPMCVRRSETSARQVGQPNPYEAPGCQEPHDPEERIVPIFPPWLRPSVVSLWQRVPSSLPYPGAPTRLHQTLLEVFSPLW